MFRKQVLFCIFALCSVLACAQPPVQSDAFVDSIGVNVHLSNGNTIYNNFPLIQSALVTLGTRHVRDALVETNIQSYYDRHNQLGALGIKGLFSAAIADTPEMLQNWPSHVPSSFEGYEMPNEMDRYTGGIAQLQAYIPAFANAASTGAMPSAQVIGPSLTLTPSYAALGDISSYITHGNLHTYYGGRNPGTSGWGGPDPKGARYGSLQYALDYEQLNSGTKPVFMTETGYDYATNYPNYISESVGGTYMPRLFLENWLRGVKRTYVYELVTGIPSPNKDFGLLRPDGSPRPAFTALSNLTSLLADPGPAFNPTLLFYTVNGGDSYLHKLLLQKRNGTYFLLLWVEKPSWEPDKHYSYTVAPESVTLSSTKSFDNAIVHQWDAQGNVTLSTLPGGNSFPLTVTDKIMVLELTPAGGQVKLNLAASPSSAGTVTASPATPDSFYANGTNVTLTATPNPGYLFTGFTGNTASAASPLTVTMNTATVETANFACSYTPAASTASFTSRGGTIAIPYTTGATCTDTPVSTAPWLTATSSGGNLTLSAASNPGVARTGTVTLGNAALTINQGQGSSYINATVASNVPGTYILVDGKAYYSGNRLRWLPNGTHTIAPPPAQNVGNAVYLMQQWTSNGTGNAAQSIVAPLADTTLGAQFVQASYLNTLSTAGGQVTVSLPGSPLGTTNYYYPTDTVTVVATPNTGCSFVNWKGSTSTSPTLVLPMTGSSTLIAVFTCR